MVRCHMVECISTSDKSAHLYSSIYSWNGLLKVIPVLPSHAPTLGPLSSVDEHVVNLVSVQGW